MIDSTKWVIYGVMCLVGSIYFWLDHRDRIKKLIYFKNEDISELCWSFFQSCKESQTWKNCTVVEIPPPDDLPTMSDISVRSKTTLLKWRCIIALLFSSFLPFYQYFLGSRKMLTVFNTASAFTSCLKPVSARCEYCVKVSHACTKMSIVLDRLLRLHHLYKPHVTIWQCLSKLNFVPPSKSLKLHYI